MSDTNPQGSRPDVPPAPPAGYPGAPTPPYPPAPQAPPSAYAAPGYPPAAPPAEQNPYAGTSQGSHYQTPAQQYPQAPYPYGTYPYAPAAKTNVLAIIAFVASLTGILFILPILGSLAAVIMGHISLSQLKTSGEKGRGLALAGTIIGWVGVGFVVLVAIFLIIGFSIAAAGVSTYSS